MDPLTILIEADASGLQSQLTKGMGLVSKFVSDMNSQQINWESILAGSLDLSIISGVAATFAQAIAQEVQFQSAAVNLNNLNTPSTQALSTPSGAPSATAFNEAIASGASLGDSTSAIEAFSKAGLDSAAALQATTDAAGIARDTGQSMEDVVNELVPLFQNWGVTTQSGVTSALTGLANAAQNGTFSFQELTSMISDQGANLSSKTDISNVAVELATLSTQSGLTKNAISDSFGQISSSVTDAANGMNALLGGPGSVGDMISSGPNGLITAFTNIQAKVDSVAPAVRNEIAKQMGLSTTDVASFSNTTTSDFQKAGVAATALEGNLTPLPTILSQNETATAKLGVAWNNFTTELDKWVIPASITALTAALNGINGILGAIGKAATAVGGSNLFSALLSLGGGGVSGIPSAIGDLIGGGIDTSIANRNNNPGDLRYAGQEGATANANGFAQFSSFAAGFTALQNQLSLDISRSGSESISQFASTYAPASDGNNPQQYAQELATQLHTTVGAPISSLASEIQQFAVAVAHNEDSKNPNLAQFSSGNGGTVNNITLNSSVAGASQNGSTSLYNQFMGLVTLLHL